MKSDSSLQPLVGQVVEVETDGFVVRGLLRGFDETRVWLSPAGDHVPAEALASYLRYEVNVLPAQEPR
jgi:hypothetical protein